MFCIAARKSTIRKPHQCQLSTKAMAGRTVIRVAEKGPVETADAPVGQLGAEPAIGVHQRAPDAGGDHARQDVGQEEGQPVEERPPP